jgi:dynamin 1-like protein
MNDMVPKTIMAFLVNKTKTLAQRELVAAIYNESTDMKVLLGEDEATMRKREGVKMMVVSLERSLSFLDEVRDFYFESEPF